MNTRGLIINQIKDLVRKDIPNETELNNYINRLKKLKKNESLKEVLGVLKESSYFNGKEWVGKEPQEIQETFRVNELYIAILNKEISERSKQLEGLKDYIEFESFMGFSIPVDNDCRKELNIKNINSIKKSEFMLSPLKHKNRALILDHPFKSSKIKDITFFKSDDLLSYCYEYQVGGTEFYKDRYDFKRLTVIITEMFGCNLLNQKNLVKLCTHFYNDKPIDFINPMDILWIIERPISENKSNYYQISFDISFKMDIRYMEEINRFNRLYSLSLAYDTKEIIIYSTPTVKKIKNLKQVKVLHQLNNLFD